MNDIERYNWWHSEMDVYLYNKAKENQAVVDYAKRIGKPLDEFVKTENFCEFIKKQKEA